MTTFADVVSDQLQFSTEIAAEKLVLELIDTHWVQRLRDISQTGNTRLVYMFSEHSRFGHSIGVANLTCRLLQKLYAEQPELVAPYYSAIAAAALLHDLGHVAPGSHTALKAWFPGKVDQHEETSCRIIAEDQEINQILNNHQVGLVDLVDKILQEDNSLPTWTWQIISGGGWNADRGNWCVVDSVMAGVAYGKYNINALTNAITIAPDGSLALKAKRLDAMLHFALSRHAMYKQVYQHRVLLAADQLTIKVVKRCRDLPSDTFFTDQNMQAVLSAASANELTVEQIDAMRESWWRYHLQHWTQAEDSILADLATRLLDRKLFKTISVNSENEQRTRQKLAEVLAQHQNFPPEYYSMEISSGDRFVEDSHKSMRVLNEDGSVTKLKDTDSFFQIILNSELERRQKWLVVPAELKVALSS